MQDEAAVNVRISPPSVSVRTRKRNKSIKDSAKLALESIPQIPIHVTEIKKLIIKDNLNAKSMTSDNDLDEERLLSVLTHGSTGRNPTFFKAYGHNDVFGLRVAIPEGCTTLEVAENLPSEDPGGMDESGGVGSENLNVLYVQLPDGHPVITGADRAITNSVATVMSSTTGNSEETPVILSEKSAAVQPSLSFEEAVEDAEFIFDDDQNMDDITQIAEEHNTSSNLLPSSSGTSLTASTSTIIPDLKLVTVLSMTNEPTSIISKIPPDQNSVLTTAIPENTLRNKLAAETRLEKDHINENANILEGRAGRFADKLQISNDVKEVPKLEKNKCAVTLVEITKQGSAPKDSLNGDAPEVPKTVLEIDTTLKTRSKKGETITTDPKTMVHFNVLAKEPLHEIRKQARENPATEIVSIITKKRTICSGEQKPKINCRRWGKQEEKR